jgi:hypothetical protein
LVGAALAGGYYTYVGADMCLRTIPTWIFEDDIVGVVLTCYSIGAIGGSIVFAVVRAGLM